MKGEALKRLAKVCDLARIDIDANAPLLLTGTSDSLAAHYRGSYSSAYRTVESDAGEIETVVSAKQFASMAGLLEGDEEVKLRQTGRGLAFSAGHSHFELKRMEREIDPLVCPENAALSLQLEDSDRRDGLLTEIDIASNFVAKTLARPIFTGIRLTFTQTRLGIESSDGFGLIYRATLPCNGPAGTARFTVPTFDFKVGLQICDGPEEAVISLNEGKVSLTANGAGFDCSLLAGEWPLIKLLPQPGSHILRMDSALLKRAVAAASLFEEKDLRFVPRAKRISLQFAGEGGGFVAYLNGTLEKEMRYDIGALALIASMGKDLQFDVAIDAPLHVQQGHRHAWLMNKR